MSWLLFTLLAINIWAVANIIDKNVVSRRVKNPLMPVIISGFGSVFYAAAAFLVFNASFSLIGVVLGIWWFAILSLYYKSMQLEEASRVMAFYSLVPIIVAVSAFFFLGEIFGIEKYIGIALVVGGAMLISLRRSSSKIKISKVLFFILPLVFIDAFHSIAVKNYINDVGFFSIFANMLLGLFLGGIILSFPYRKEIRKVKSKTVFVILLSQIFGIVGLLAFVYAISLGPVSLVTAVGTSQPFFVLFYAVIVSLFKPHIIEEEISKKAIATKLIAISIMFLGVYLVST